MIVPLQVAHPVRRPIAGASPRATYPVGSIKVLNANGRGQWHRHQLSTSTRLLIRKNSRGEMDPHRDFVACQGKCRSSLRSKVTTRPASSIT